MSLFKEDVGEASQIPLEPIMTLLNKYNGKAASKQNDDRLFYQIKKLPKILVINIKRFVKNNFFVESIPNQVVIPLEGIDLSAYLAEGCEQGVQTKYRLLSNIVHEGKYGAGHYKVSVNISKLGLWIELQDLYTRETIETLVLSSQAYLLFFEREDN